MPRSRLAFEMGGEGGQLLGFAKVTRDRIMLELHTQDPRYGFDRHKGYATLVTQLEDAKRQLNVVESLDKKQLASGSELAVEVRSRFT